MDQELEEHGEQNPYPKWTVCVWFLTNQIHEAIVPSGVEARGKYSPAYVFSLNIEVRLIVFD